LETVLTNNFDSRALISGIKKIATETILPNFAAVSHLRKSDGSFITEIDISAQKQAAALLNKIMPGIPMLGEEMSTEEQQNLLSNSPLLWCLDPLDGTTNFSRGLPYFSISLALISKGVVLFALVYDPVRDECFTAHNGQGAHLNGTRLQLPTEEQSIKDAIGLVDFKRLPDRLAIPLITKPPYTSQRSLGSVALDWCWMASNRCQLYLHSRQKLWDFAAGLLIFTEAGGKHETLDGRQLDYSHLESQLAYAAINNSLLSQWGEWLKKQQ